MELVKRNSATQLDTGTTGKTGKHNNLRNGDIGNALSKALQPSIHALNNFVDTIDSLAKRFKR